MDLRGPSTLEIEGSRYPMTTEESPTIYLGGGHNERRNVDESYMVVFGTPPYAEGRNEVWMPVRILRYDDKKRVLLSDKKICPAKRGSAYKLKLKISNTSLQARINNKSIGKGKKSRGVWGYLGFDCKGWERVTLSGEVEPSWLQSKVDAALGEQREVFDKTYDGSKILPGWLFEAVPESSTEAGDQAEQDLPESLAPAHWPRLKEAYDAFACEDYTGALTVIARMKAEAEPWRARLGEPE